MRARCASLVVRPTAPRLCVGLVIAALLIIAETLVLYPLKAVAPESTLGVVYLLGVVVVAIVWGLWPAAATCVASVLAFDFFHIPPLFALSPTAAGDWVAIAVYLVVALAASTLSELARLRAAEADQRRREAEASRDELRMLADQQAPLRRIATLVAHAVAPSELFSAVAEELARCLGVTQANLVRYQADGGSILLASHDDRGSRKEMPVGRRFAYEGENVAAMHFTVELRDSNLFGVQAILPLSCDDVPPSSAELQTSPGVFGSDMDAAHTPGLRRRVDVS